MSTALITGCSRRLGLYLVEQLLNEGWQVHALTRSASDQLNALASEQLHIHQIYSYSLVQVQRAIEQIQASCAELELLVNNASMYEADEREQQLGGEFYTQLFFIHMQLPALLASAFKPALQKAQGNIISITDIYADNPKADSSLYCSTKAGLQNLSLGLAKKLAPNVRVNCIQPGPIKFLEEHSEKHQQQVLSETLIAREGGFGPVYETLKFILTNRYITGSCIKVDGGRALMRG